MIVAGPALLFVNQPSLIDKPIRLWNAMGAISSNSGDSYVRTYFAPLQLLDDSINFHPYTAPITSTSIPSLGLFTTTVSPAQASTLMFSLISKIIVRPLVQAVLE